MRVILCAFDKALYEAWRASLAKMEALPAAAGVFVDVHIGDITALETTAVVSPANSYGYMRGGVDLAYTRRFGQGLEDALRRRIAALPGGILPVGEALVVETGDAAIPYLISAPTMTTPMRLTDGAPVFASARAAMTSALEHAFDSVAFPGMGTGTGGLDVAVASAAMLEGIAQAVREF